ncbi:Inner membrane transporter rhtA [Oligella ureolytica]|uniref:EamA family transporter n=1 Tax=Oligella ureolytica TaxID=90244 RepID=UPI000E00F757|nr:DMT family transporter [Oligella ureolytica]SUA58960.1 Inner membrane transporter rhtA [Oligella ureolytica]
MVSTERQYPMSLGALALILSIISLCVGTSFAKSLFDSLGPIGTTTLRLVFSTCFMWLFWRPWRLALTRSDLASVIPYGVCMVGMNSFFYLAIGKLPLGVAIAIQFSGPLTIAVLSSRSKYDFLWVLLALSGLYLLLWPSAESDELFSLDLSGIVFALIGGVFWACYILVGQRARMIHPGLITSYGFVTASLIILPIGIITAGPVIFNPNILLYGLGIALLSSAIPFTLEIFSLRILPLKTFSIMVSLEPAIGALTGIIILNEMLEAREWIAVLLIVFAAIGTTATTVQNSRRTKSKSRK